MFNFGPLQFMKNCTRVTHKSYYLSRSHSRKLHVLFVIQRITREVFANSCPGKSHCRYISRPALSGGMDWWRMESPFSRVRKIFLRSRNLQENPRNSAERAIFAKFQAPKSENSEPEKMQFHTPSHSRPPLDSLLIR